MYTALYTNILFIVTQWNVTTTVKDSPMLFLKPHWMDEGHHQVYKAHQYPIDSVLQTLKRQHSVC